MGSGPTLVTSFYLHPLFEGLISKYCHILRSRGSGLHRVNFGDTFQPIPKIYSHKNGEIKTKCLFPQVIRPH